MRQLFWCSLQIAVFGSTVYWMNTPEMKDHGGDNAYAVTVLALMLTMAVTAAVMITRDSASFVIRRVRALRQPNQPNDRPDWVNATPRLSKPRELSARGRIGKQPS